MVEKPEGCSATMQVSYIADEKLRPHPESRYLYEVATSHGETVVGVCTSLDKAINYAQRAFK